MSYSFLFNNNAKIIIIIILNTIKHFNLQIFL